MEVQLGHTQEEQQKQQAKQQEIGQKKTPSAEEQKWFRSEREFETQEKQTPKVYVEQEQVLLEKREKPIAVQEVIVPTEREVIQPVIYREVEKTEIRPEIFESYERVTKPVGISEKTLPVEERGTQHREGDLTKEFERVAQVHSSREEVGVTRRVIEREPIVKEYIVKHEVEVIQPVIHREVIKEHETRTTKPIHEKIIEPPVILKTQVLRQEEEQQQPQFKKETQIGEGLHREEYSFPQERFRGEERKHLGRPEIPPQETLFGQTHREKESREEHIPHGKIERTKRFEGMTESFEKQQQQEGQLQTTTGQQEEQMGGEKRLSLSQQQLDKLKNQEEDLRKWQEEFKKKKETKKKETKGKAEFQGIGLKLTKEQENRLFGQPQQQGEEMFHSTREEKSGKEEFQFGEKEVGQQRIYLSQNQLDQMRTNEQELKEWEKQNFQKQKGLHKEKKKEFQGLGLKLSQEQEKRLHG